MRKRRPGGFRENYRGKRIEDRFYIRIALYGVFGLSVKKNYSTVLVESNKNKPKSSCKIIM